MTPKIATCCYCGTRAALVLKGTTRHELSCSACGAPLHNMKMLKTERETAPAPKQSRGRPAAYSVHRPSKPKRKKKKSKAKWLMGEAWDLIEDIFD